MYTKQELLIAKRVISRVAHENSVPETQVRAEVLAAMNAGRHDPDPNVQARWPRFHYAGAEPTVEELVLWLAELTIRRMKCT